MNTVILTCYPLPEALLSRLTPEIGPKPRLLPLSTLRSMPMSKLWSVLRNARADRVVAVMTDPSEKVVLPVLLTIASLIPAGGIFVKDLSSSHDYRVPRARALTGFWATIVATLAGYWQRYTLSKRIKHLLSKPRLAILQPSSTKALYIKTNLMLGTHAGGSVGHVAGIVNELHRRDANVLVQALEFPATVEPDVRFEGIPGLSHYGTPPESNQLRFNRPATERGRKALEREEFGFIYQRMTLANFTGVELSHAHHVPLVLEYNGSEVWVSRHWGLPLKWERLCRAIEDCCLRHAALVVTVSEPLRDELLARGVPEQRIVTYPNCIDPAIFDPGQLAADGRRIRHELGFEDGDFVGIFVGTFGRWHGADVLAEAVQMIREQQPSGRRVRFLFVGDGLLAAQIRDRLADAVEAGDAVFTGLVSQAQTPAYLAAADFCLSPHLPPQDGSRFFGSPTKLFEYMAMGKPIIASRLEQLEEVLGPQDGDPREVAILVEPGSAKALARAIAALNTDDEGGAALGAAARARALLRYTWTRHVDEIFAALKLGRVV